MDRWTPACRQRLGHQFKACANGLDWYSPGALNQQTPPGAVVFCFNRQFELLCSEDL
jgi:hypothetical protein